jgi:N-acetylglucosamine kinase-like BadF-type ATPase
MTDCLLALDIGGTKTHLVIEDTHGTRLLDTILHSREWDAEPADLAAEWIAERIKPHIPAGMRIAAMAFGAQGINRTETADDLQKALAVHGLSASIVNDAALIALAGGFPNGIGIIAGTGAIGVGVDASGAHLATGGWGPVIGDEGGAAALVREATRAALRSLDEGKPDDGLLGALIRDFGVADAERLTRKVNDEPTSDNWAPHCPAIFAAAAAGSALAARIIDEGAQYLATLVDQLLARGAVGTDIVVAGSVIVNQPPLFEAFERHVSARHSHLRIHKLTIPPVEGAVFLARRAFETATL